MLRKVISIKKGSSISCSNELRASFAAAVRVKATHSLTFTVAPYPFAVFITFISCHIHHGLDARRVAYSFKQMYRAHDVGRVSFDRVYIRTAYQWLGRQMQNYFGLVGCHHRFQFFQIPDVRQDADHVVDDFCFIKQVWMGNGCQSVTHNL